MNPKSLRTIAVMGFLAIIAMTGLMFFSLDQVSEASGIKVAKRVHATFERSLDPDAGPTRLGIRALGDGPGAAKHCTLRLWPTVSVSRSEETIERLALRAAEEVISQLRAHKGDIIVTAVIVLPDGSERRRSFDRSLKVVEPPPEPELERQEQAAAR